MAIKKKVKRLISFEPPIYKKLQEQSKKQFDRPITAIVNEIIGNYYEHEKYEDAMDALKHYPKPEN